LAFKFFALRFFGFGSWAFAAGVKHDKKPRESKTPKPAACFAMPPRKPAARFAAAPISRPKGNTGASAGNNADNSARNRIRPDPASRRHVEVSSAKRIRILGISQAAHQAMAFTAHEDSWFNRPSPAWVHWGRVCHGLACGWGLLKILNSDCGGRRDGTFPGRSR